MLQVDIYHGDDGQYSVVFGEQRDPLNYYRTSNRYETFTVSRGQFDGEQHFSQNGNGRLVVTIGEHWMLVESITFHVDTEVENKPTPIHSWEGRVASFPVESITLETDEGEVKLTNPRHLNDKLLA